MLSISFWIAIAALSIIIGIGLGFFKCPSWFYFMVSCVFGVFISMTYILSMWVMVYLITLTLVTMIIVKFILYRDEWFNDKEE